MAKLLLFPNLLLFFHCTQSKVQNSYFLRNPQLSSNCMKLPGLKPTWYTWPNSLLWCRYMLLNIKTKWPNCYFSQICYFSWTPTFFQLPEIARFETNLILFPYLLLFFNCTQTPVQNCYFFHYLLLSSNFMENAKFETNLILWSKSLLSSNFMKLPGL